MVNKKCFSILLSLFFVAGLVVAGGEAEPDTSGEAATAETGDTLSILMFSSFVAENDEDLQAIAEEFGEQKGIDVQVDFIGIQEMYPRLSSEADSRSGHDIVGLENLQVSLYQDSLLSISDTVETITEEYGDFADVSREAVVRNGEWKALPWWIVPFNATYREDFFADVGFDAPDTWQDLLEAGRALKQNGTPIGIPLGSTGDANNSLYQLMWGFGAAIADESGVVAIDSSETREAIRFVQTLYEDAMTRDVVGWAENGANNRFILSGDGAWTFNPISIWVVAKRDFPDLAENLNHHGALRGPEGRHGAGDFYSLAIWEFSDNKELAKEFLAYLYEEEQMNRYLGNGQGFNLPTHPHFYDHPVFLDPTLEGLRGYADNLRLTGWPAPPDARAQGAYQRWIVPNMFLSVIGGSASIDQAISEAEAELIEVGYEPAE